MNNKEVVQKLHENEEFKLIKTKLETNEELLDKMSYCQSLSGPKEMTEVLYQLSLMLSRSENHEEVVDFFHENLYLQATINGDFVYKVVETLNLLVWFWWNISENLKDSIALMSEIITTIDNDMKLSIIEKPQDLGYSIKWQSAYLSVNNTSWQLINIFEVWPYSDFLKKIDTNRTTDML